MVDGPRAKAHLGCQFLGVEAATVEDQGGCRWINDLIVAAFCDRLCAVNRHLYVLHLNVVSLDPSAVRVFGPGYLLQQTFIDAQIPTDPDRHQVDDMDYPVASEMGANIVTEGGRGAW